MKSQAAGSADMSRAVAQNISTTQPDTATGKSSGMRPRILAGSPPPFNSQETEEPLQFSSQTQAFTASRNAPVQRALSADEKELLRGRVGETYGTYRFDEDKEIAIGLKDAYKLIRYKDGSLQWRKRPRGKKGGGHGFFGRLGDNEPTMGDVADQANYVEALSSGSASASSSRSSQFSAASSIGPRKNNNTVMGTYFFGKPVNLSATTYAQTENCEWLHMHGHGLGGDEAAGNLYAGSHASNSHMAAVELAVQELNTNGLDVDIVTDVTFDHHYHVEGNVDKILASLIQDGEVKDAERAELRASILAKDSYMPLLISYHVLVDGEIVHTEDIMPFQEGRFDEVQFNKIMKAAKGKMLGQKQPVEFVSGGFMGD